MPVLLQQGDPPAVMWVVVIVAHAAMILLAVRAGRRQARLDDRTSAARAVWVGAVAGSLAALPMYAWVATEVSSVLTPIDLFPVAFATITSMQHVLQFLLPPARFKGTDRRLPEVTDEKVKQNVAELARGFGLETPRLEQLNSTAGSLSAMAYAGGVVAPSLVVTDGVLHRLPPEERDAILAHELAHVATGSLWGLMIVGPASWAIGLLLAGGFGWLASLLFAAVVHVGLTRLVTRYYEILCDRRAAQVVGFGSTILALDKIHRVHPVRDEGMLSLLFYATATHPHRSIRIDALRRAAPPDERERLPLPPEPASRHRLAVGVAIVIWLSVVGVVVLRGPHLNRGALIGGLVAFFCLPIVLQTVLVWRKLRRGRRRLGVGMPGARWLFAGFLTTSLGMLLLAAFRGDTPVPLLFLGPVGAVFMVIGLVRTWPVRKLRRAVGVALLEKNYEGAIEVARSRRDVLDRDPALRHDVFLCEALCGREDSAIAGLRALTVEVPKLRVARITLSLIEIRVDPAAGLEDARWVANQLEDDPLPRVLAARCLVKLGRVEEARAAAAEARRLDPEEAVAFSVSAEAELASGETDAAAEYCHRAHDLGPGDAMVLFIRAKLAIATESHEQARRATERAIETAEASPFALLAKEARELIEELDRRHLAAR